MCRCRHNEVYWQGNAQYYAFGLGAASYLQRRRFSRPRGMGAYKRWVAEFAASGAGFPGVYGRSLCAHLNTICGQCKALSIYALSFCDAMQTQILVCADFKPAHPGSSQTALHPCENGTKATTVILDIVHVQRAKRI